MKCILLFALYLLFIPSAKAWEYQLEKDTLLKPSIIDLNEISEHFINSGFYSMSDTSLTKIGLPFDNAYMGLGMEQNLLIKAGLSYPSQFEGLVIYEPELEVHIVHFKFRNTPYMVMGLNFKESDFKKAVAPWLKVQRTSWFNLLIPSAHAESCEIEDYASKELSTVSQTLSGEAILKKIGECGLEALKGAKGSGYEYF